jgi:hypothetical protein
MSGGRNVTIGQDALGNVIITDDNNVAVILQGTKQIPEDQIAALRDGRISPTDLPGAVQLPDPDVFLSYASPDARSVEILAEALEDKGRLNVWLDRWVLVPGEHWQQQMARGLETAKTCAVCIGNQTPQGWFREEIERALNRQTKNPTFRVIPVILPDGNSSCIDYFLELRTWVDFRNGFDDPRAFHDLVSGIHGLRPGRFHEEQVDDHINRQLIRTRLEFIRDLGDRIEKEVRIEFQKKMLDILFNLE